MATSGKNNIGIRPYNPGDIKPFYEAIISSIGHITHYVPWNDLSYSMEDATYWITSRPDAWKKGEEYSFAIYSTETDKFLGSVDVENVNWTHRFANLGYWVQKNTTNKSVATEAAKLAIEFVFKELKLNRLEITMDVDNIASKRVAEKVGAQKEGILRNRYINRGNIRSAIMYSLIPEDLNL